MDLTLPPVVETRLLAADRPEALALAAACLRRGELVVFPTDTLYGIGADATNAAAIDRLYRVKQRPLAKGIPVLLGDASDLERLVAELPASARPLMEHFWPGPLTLLLPRAAHLPANLSPNEKIAVRLIDQPQARALIRAAGGAVATSSANHSGEAPARTASAALAALGGQVSVVLDGGRSPQTMASTILDCTTRPPRLVRLGPVPAEALAACLPGRQLLTDSTL